MNLVRRIFPLCIILFLGYFGFSLTLPLFPALFLNTNTYFLSLSITKQTRQILLGILLAMYPLGQFIGAPILGKWSDKYGRKPILLISLIILVPAYFTSAIAILYAQPVLLFISRFFTGLLAGDIVIAQAAVADTSKDVTTKTKSFGWLMFFGSTAFFFGPLIGGSLADSTVVSWFHYETPFFCAAILSIVSFIVVALLFQETHKADRNIEISLRTLFYTFGEGFKSSHLRIFFIANFFMYLAIFFFLNFFSAYLIVVYRFSVAALGRVNAYFSVPMIAVPFVCSRFNDRWSVKSVMQVISFFLGISYIIFVLFQSSWSLLFTLIPISFFIGFGLVFSSILISDAVDSGFQGQALGINQSVLVLAEALTAVLGGFCISLLNTSFFYIAFVCSILVFFILFCAKKQNTLSL